MVVCILWFSCLFCNLFYGWFVVCWVGVLLFTAVCLLIGLFWCFSVVDVVVYFGFAFDV